MSIENKFRGMDVQSACGLLNKHYLEGIYSVMYRVASEYKRVFAFRVDLRFPRSKGIDYPNCDLRMESAISRFVDSFKSQIKNDLAKKQRNGTRVYPCVPRCVWCREKDSSDKYHYHVLILLNKDAYFTLGDYRSDLSLAHKVRKAWRSAVNLPCIEEAIGLVHFPVNPVYYLDRGVESFDVDFSALFYRVSYFAKFNTKVFGTRKHNFGYSLN